MDAPATIPELFERQSARFADKINTYHKDRASGRWTATTWGQAARHVRSLANALLARGVQPGDRIGVIAETRVEWVQCDLAIVCVGAVTVGVYPTSTAAQCAYVLDHAETALVVVEDVAQLEKVRPTLPPCVRDLVLIDAPQGPLPAGTTTLAALLAEGDAYAAAHPAAYDARRRQVRPEDLAMLVYTSGTTGPPKGVMLTHKNVMRTVVAVTSAVPTRDDELSVVFLPLAHSLQRTTSYAGLWTGGTGVFAERLDLIVEHMKQFKPTIQPAVPRIYEKIHARILAMLHDAPPRRRRIFDWAVGVGREVARRSREGQPVSPLLRAQHALADRLVLRRIREVFGGNIRFMISGAAPIAVELLEFFHACGVLVLEGWGLTETTAPATVNRPEQFKFGTVGLDLPCCETKIAEDGEILVRGENVFTGYYRDPDATREAFTDDGWFKTGDIGTKDAAGFLRITDRKKELIVTAGGKNISPANIENTVKSASPLISQCVVFGDKRRFLVALIALDPEEAKVVSARRGVPVTALEPEVRVAIEKANDQLARYETIKRFRVLDQELTVQDDLLTPTLKLKRKNIQARYGALIDVMYTEAEAERDDAQRAFREGK